MAPVLSKTPETLVTSGWSDYALLDSGDGKKLERYGRYTVVRPEPQCFWSPRDPKAFENATATFDPQQEEEDSGRWRFDKHGPIDAFPLKWRDVKFTGRFTPFRHLAFFPEQAANWGWLDGRVRDFTRSAGRAPKILNLFGYTGVASLAAAAAGAEVTHVDASKKSVAYARENAEQSGLAQHPIRWIVEDARKYVAREVRRGSKYDGVILDPPKYGRGPTGEVWRQGQAGHAGCIGVQQQEVGIVRQQGGAVLEQTRHVLKQAPDFPRGAAPVFGRIQNDAIVF